MTHCLNLLRYIRLFLNVHVYLNIILVLTAISGDYLIKRSNLQLHHALFDNTTHALIGGISWFIVSTVHKNRYAIQTILEIALCTVIASCIDLDHFFMARSLYLKDATNLKNRPPLHCTTIPLVIVCMLISIGYYQKEKWILRLSCIIFTAFISHHVRDATRRGFWIYPFGSTRPVPYVAYICLTIVIPYIVCLFIHYTQFNKFTNSAITV